ACPLLCVASEARAALRGMDRVFELESVPVAARSLRRSTVRWIAEHPHGRLAVVGEVAVDADPAPVLHRVVAAQRIPDLLWHLAVDLQVAGAAHRRGSGANINVDFLIPVLPQL